MPLTEQQQALRVSLVAQMREREQQHSELMRYRVQARDVSCLLVSYYRVDEFQFGRLTLYIPKVRKIGNRRDVLTFIGTVSRAVYPLQRYEIGVCGEIAGKIAEALEPEGYFVKRLGGLANPVNYMEYSIVPNEWKALWRTE